MSDELNGIVENSKVEITATIQTNTIIQANVSLGHIHTNKSVLDNIQNIEDIKDKSFVFEQPTASNKWVIEHNLGKYPSITIVDSANSVVVGDVDYKTINLLEVSFNGEFVGKAYLN